MKSAVGPSWKFRQAGSVSQAPLGLKNPGNTQGIVVTIVVALVVAFVVPFVDVAIVATVVPFVVPFVVEFVVAGSRIRAHRKVIPWC